MNLWNDGVLCALPCGIFLSELPFVLFLAEHLRWAGDEWGIHDG